MKENREKREITEYKKAIREERRNRKKGRMTKREVERKKTV